MSCAEEMSRVHWQSAAINNAPTGSDPGSGGFTGTGSGSDGGGGSTPDDGGYTPRQFSGDGPIP
jgi:hypothetical protein